MIAILLTQKIIQLFLTMIMGYIIVKAGILKADDSFVLTKLAVYLITPCAILNAFQVDFTPGVREGYVFGFFMAVILLSVSVLIGKACEKLLCMDVVEKSSVVYSNSLNLIIPIVSYVLGPEWLIYTSSYFSVQLIFMWSHGVSLYAGKGTLNLKKIMSNPNMVAVAAGIVMLITGLRLPKLVNDTFAPMTDMLGPVNMLIIGMIIAKTDLKAMVQNKRIYLVAFVRMIVCPLIVLLILKLSHGELLVQNGDIILLITFLATIAPSASSMAQFAQLYGKDDKYAGAISIMTTLICIVTMPAFVYLYEMI